MVVGVSNTRGKFKLFGLHVTPSPPSTPIFLSYRVLGLLTVMILEKVSESIFFRRNTFTACKDKDKKKKGGKLFDGVQPTEDYASILR